MRYNKNTLRKELTDAQQTRNKGNDRKGPQERVETRRDRGRGKTNERSGADAGVGREGTEVSGNERVAHDVQPTTTRTNVTRGKESPARVPEKSRTSSGPILPGETKAKAGNEQVAQGIKTQK